MTSRPWLPLLAATGCACATLAIAACTSFAPSDPPAEGGAPPDAIDVDARDGPNPDASDASTRWCATQEAGFLCDDFDNPKATPTDWAPWARLDETGLGSGKRDTTRALSLPTSFVAIADGISRHFLQKQATLTGKHLVWAFDMSIEALSVPNLVVAEIAFGAPEVMTFSFSADGAKALSGVVDYPPFGVSRGLVMPSLTPKLGEWVHVQIERLKQQAPDGGAALGDEYRIKIGNAPPVLVSGSFPPVEVALGLGARLNATTGTGTARFDNVTIVLE